MPVTVLDLAEATRADEPPEVEGVVRATAEAVQAAAPREDDEPAPDPVAVLTRQTEAPAHDAVAEEARKGYDLLVLGVGPTVGPEGGFSEEVARVAGAFEGPLALATARGAHEKEPLNGRLSILAPVTGAEVSRRGAEVALALAKAADAQVTLLSVARKVTGSSLRSRLLGEARRSREALLKEIVGVADQYGVEVRTATRSDLPPADAILRQARLGGHNLIVMGVSRRAGEILFFGDVAAAVLEASDRSLLLRGELSNRGEPPCPPTSPACAATRADWPSSPRPSARPSSATSAAPPRGSGSCSSPTRTSRAGTATGWWTPATAGRSAARGTASRWPRRWTG